MENEGGKNWSTNLRHCPTERIWLRAFGTSPKFLFEELQIRSGHYLQHPQEVKYDGFNQW